MKIKNVNFIAFCLCFILANLIAMPFLVNIMNESEVALGDSGSMEGEIIITDDDSQTDNNSTNEVISIDSADDVIRYALQSLNNAFSIDSVTTGIASTYAAGQNVKQTISDYLKVDSNGNAMSKTQSTKTGAMGENVYRETYYDGKYVYQTTSASWAKYITYTKDAYISKFGLFVNELNYNINSSTIDKIEDYGKSVVTIFDINSKKQMTMPTKFVTIKLRLAAADKYAVYLNEMSGSSVFPKFSNIQITLHVATKGSFAGQLVVQKTIDTYSVKKFGFDAVVTNDTTTTFQNFSNYFLIKDPR